MTSLRKVTIGLLVALVVPACGIADGVDEDGLSIVATTTILGDVVGQVAGEEASVEVLMPIGADPHDFQASAAQIAALNSADLVVANGLGLEEGLSDALAAAESDGVLVLEVGPLVDPIPFRDAHSDDAHEGDDHGDEDPHFWFDPVRIAEAARLVGDALTSVDPAGSWSVRADAFAADLEAADQQILEILSFVAADRRKLVTSHESFGYFADRYGFEVIGVVIPGGSTLSEPSSDELAQLIATMVSEDVTAIFGETTQQSSVVEAIASELGDEVAIVELFTGSLGEPGSGADTLIGLLITNAELIAEALSG